MSFSKILMYDHTQYHGREYFCCYSLQAFSTVKILKYLVKDCFKINGKQIIKMPNTLGSKTMKEK